MLLFLFICIYNVAWVQFLKRRKKKKRKKITFENIDTNPEALNLATPFSLISLVTGCQGFPLSHMAYIFTHFLYLFIITSYPLSSLIFRAIMDHAACPAFVWVHSKWGKLLSQQMAGWFCSWMYMRTESRRNWRESVYDDT